MNDDVLLKVRKDTINIREVSMGDISIDYYGKEDIINKLLIESKMKKKETVITANIKEISLDDVLKIMESK